MKTKPNKKIGIIGGVGPQATGILYGQIIKLSQEKYSAKDNDDFPKIVIESVPIPDFITDTKKVDEAKEMLIKATKNLEKVGATRMVIASNTVHLTLDDLQKETKVPFLSMIDLVVKECTTRGFEKVGLLSSPVTIKSKSYEKKLEQENIQMIKPTKKEQELTDRIIRHVLAGSSNGKYRKAYIDLLNGMYKRGAEAVILGCTELPMAINYEALGDRVIDSMEVLAKGLTNYYYQKRNE